MNNLKKIFLSFSRKEKAAFIAAAAVFLVSGIVLFGMFVKQTTHVIPAQGGEYTEGMVGQPTFLNPVLAATEIDRSLVHLLFATAADLADSIESESAGRTWRMRLKEGLIWTDGRKLTSDDIIFTIQKIQDPETQSPLYASWQGVTVERESELEVRFNLVGPYPFFEGNLQNLHPMPKHLFVDTPAANWKLSEFNLQPVGSGPFRFGSFEKQPNGFLSTYHLLANPNYALGRPLLDQVEVKFFPRSEEVLREFNTGLVDGFGSFDAGLLKDIQRPYNLAAFAMPSYYGVFWNQTQNAVLQSLAVRKALSDAVDRRILIEGVFDGHAVPMTNPLPHTIFPFEATSAPSLDEVKTALDEAGWRMGEGGVRTRTERNVTNALEFSLTVPKIPFLVATADRLAETWTELGAKVNVIQVNPEEVAQRTIKNREYQAILFGNILNPLPDLYSFWHSNERFHPGLNLALYNNRRADQAIEAIRREMDADKREEELKNLQATIIADYPAVFLYSPSYVFATSKDLRGVEPRLLAETPDRFADSRLWYVKTARTLK